MLENVKTGVFLQGVVGNIFVIELFLEKKQSRD